MIDKFARHVAATLCLTVASGGAAVASTIVYNEGTALQTLTPLVNPAAETNPGTTTVNGTQTGFDSEWEISGLGTGTFTITASSDGLTGDYLRVYSASCFVGACFIESNTLDNAGLTNFISRPIPATGDLFFLIQPNSEDNDFSVSVTTTGGSSSAPEPSTIALVALGLASAAMIPRKRRGQLRR